jgi:hypothetical protein
LPTALWVYVPLSSLLIFRLKWSNQFEYEYSPERYNQRGKERIRHELRFDEIPDIGLGDENMLKWGVQKDALDLAAYDDEVENVPRTAEVSEISVPTSKMDVRQLQGFWSGFVHDVQLRVRLDFTIRPSDDGSFTGHGYDDYVGAFTVAGGEIRDHEQFQDQAYVTFRQLTVAEYPDHYYHGTMVPGSGTIVGVWGALNGEDSKVFEEHGFFRFDRRIFSLRSRPTIEAFIVNRGEALWTVASSAVRQHLWSWSFFRDRRDTRKRFVHLFYRRDVANRYWWGQISRDEMAELDRLEESLCPQDLRFYRSLAQRRTREEVIHL